MERYNEITYLLIEDIANIDYDDHIGKIYFSNKKKFLNFLRRS